MEIAIQEAKEELADSAPVEIEEVRKLLRRSYNNALRREHRAKARLAYSGIGAELEVLLPPAAPTIDPINAQHDLATILRDTPPDVRRALLMRYGARSRWEEIAEEMDTSKDAIRLRCQRELSRIRKRIGIRKEFE
jgi:DNA-directed RNA polymerase specialized sigma24 family protein